MIKWHYSFFTALISTLALFYICQIELPSNENPLVIYSTTDFNNLEKVIQKAILHTEDDLKLATYQFTSEPIQVALKKALDRKVQATTLIHGKNKNIYLSIQPNHTLLYDNNSGLMHSKVMISDSKTCYLGSTNLTESSLRLHHNLWIGIYSPSLAHFLNQSIFYKLKQTPNFWSDSIGKVHAECWLCPDTSGTLNRVLQLISTAKKSIDIACFAYTHPYITQALIKKKKEGLQVRIILDGTLALQVSKKAILEFKKNGIPIYLSNQQRLMHHKLIWIDVSALLTGSVNMTKGAFNKNRELLLILKNLNSKHRSQINNIIQSLLQESRLLI